MTEQVLDPMEKFWLAIDGKLHEAMVSHDERDDRSDPPELIMVVQFTGNEKESDD